MIRLLTCQLICPFDANASCQRPNVLQSPEGRRAGTRNPAPTAGKVTWEADSRKLRKYMYLRKLSAISCQLSALSCQSAAHRVSRRGGFVMTQWAERVVMTKPRRSWKEVGFTLRLQKFSCTSYGGQTNRRSWRWHRPARPWAESRFVNKSMLA